MYYSEEQVKNALEIAGLKIRAATRKTFITNCPFHGNSGTPAFNVARNGSGFNCHNPGCEAHGNLIQLIQATSGKSYWAARRLIDSPEYILQSIETKVRDNLSIKPEFELYDQAELDRFRRDFWNYEFAQDYMTGRGFSPLTLRHFGIGYSAAQDMVIVPMHDIKGKPIGFIARSITGKQFKNSPGLPKSESLFNIHRARATGAESIIVCEASFDVMRLHQAGFPNAVAILGDGFSDILAAQIARTFSTVIVMTDDDPTDPRTGKRPGEVLGEEIANKLKDKMVYWAHSGGNKRFPEGIKDIGDMTDEQIRAFIAGKISTWEYKATRSVV